MAELGIKEQGVFFFIFKALKNATLAQSLAFILATAFVKFSKQERLRTASAILMINLLPMFMVEFIDRIINNDKPDMLLLALFSFDWADLYFFTGSFIGYSLGQYMTYRKEKGRVASQQNEKQQTREV